MVKKLALSGIIAAGAAGIMLSAAPAQAVAPAPAPAADTQQQAAPEAAPQQAVPESAAEPQAANPYGPGNVSDAMRDEQAKKPTNWKSFSDVEGHENENTKKSRGAKQRCGGDIKTKKSRVVQVNNCVNDSIVNSNSGAIRAGRH